MLFFKKKKPYLKDLIPDNQIDIHSHLLPGIDDGAVTIEDTLFLIQSMRAFGFSSFITTPHTFSGFWDNTKEKIQANETATKKELEHNNITNSFRAASEYLMDDHFVSLFQKGEILPLKDNYVLVEMSYLNAPIQLYDILFELQVAGYKPVLAHPERYIFFHNNFNEYKKLKNAGCFFQLNLLSSVGYYGKEVANTAEKLLSQGFIDFTGSDVHHKKHIEAFDRRILFKENENLQVALANNNKIFT